MVGRFLFGHLFVVQTKSKISDSASYKVHIKLNETLSPLQKKCLFLLQASEIKVRVFFLSLATILTQRLGSDWVYDWATLLTFWCLIYLFGIPNFGPRFLSVPRWCCFSFLLAKIWHKLDWEIKTILHWNFLGGYFWHFLLWWYNCFHSFPVTKRSRVRFQLLAVIIFCGGVRF